MNLHQRLEAIFKDLKVDTTATLQKGDTLSFVLPPEAISSIEALVVEEKIAELQKHSDQWRVWQDDTKMVKLDDVINWYDLRIKELKGDKSE